MSTLFKPTRQCIACERTATARRREPGEPIIAAISFVIYYRGAGKGILKAAPKVRICSECLTRALAAPSLWERRESKRLLAAIRESLSARYSDILRLDAEALPDYAAQDSRKLARELFQEPA